MASADFDGHVGDHRNFVRSTDQLLDRCPSYGGHGFVSTLQTEVGAGGTGTFSQSEYSSFYANDLLVGSQTGGNGTYNQFKGSVSVTTLTVAAGTGSNGQFVQSGGTVRQTTALLW